MRAAVFMGGSSAERDVSLSSGRRVQAALDAERYEAVSVDTGEPDWAPAFLDAPKPDVAILCLHGPGGEDGSLQGFLQTSGIPYIGSGVLGSALCMDKELTKAVLGARDIPTPHSMTVTPAQRANANFLEFAQAFPLPLVVKPNRQGSTIGATLVRDREQICGAIDRALEFDSEVLLEEYLSGTEITACVIGGSELQALPLVEIVPQSGFYDYHDKYTAGATDEIVPARISDRLADQARKYALAAHRHLKCWGMSRTDMIVSEDRIWVLEVNTIPGMTPTSLMPRAAAAAGMTLGELLDRLIGWALERPAGY